MNLLKYLDERMGEASTYAGLATLLVVLHASIAPGLLAAITLWGTVLSGILAVILADVGSKKAPAQIAMDALNALVAGIKAMPLSQPVSPSAAPPPPTTTAQ